MKEQFKNKFVFVPLILVEVYLAFTLILYQFGPLDWKTENQVLFWSLIFLYHIAFIGGYILSMKKIPIRRSRWSIDRIDGKVESILIWGIILICVVCACIEYKNITHANSYIPYELPKNFINGLINPAEQYYNKFVAPGEYTSNKLITLGSALFSFIYVSIIPFLIVRWKKINLPQKICFLILIFFKVVVYVSVGTNKGIFDTMFTIASILAILLLLNIYHDNDENIDKLTFIKVFVLTCALVVFSFCYFTANISSRVESPVDYAISMTEKGEEEKEEQSVSTDNTGTGSDLEQSESNDGVEEDGQDNLEVPQDSEVSQDSEVPQVQEVPKQDSFLKRMYYSVTNYLTQGYYGMSLSVDEEFTTTYGIGNSQFLTSNFKSLLGIDVHERTYQHKINEKWHESQQWHSFYSYIANDISFYGVVIFMFLLGLYYGCICKDVFYNGSLIGKLILPLFVIMFMYMPANNQVFTAMATCTAFLELTFLWFVSKINWIKGKKNE